jgi:hypothetical protein
VVAAARARIAACRNVVVSKDVWAVSVSGAAAWAGTAATA